MCHVPSGQNEEEEEEEEKMAEVYGAPAEGISF